MLNLDSRSEIHDAITSIALAELDISRGDYQQAREAVIDADRHCKRGMELLERRDSTYDKLRDLVVRTHQLKSVIQARSRTARSG